MKKLRKRKAKVIPTPHDADSDISPTSGSQYLL